MGLDLVAVEPGTPVELDLQLQAVSEGVLVTGTADAETVGECVRCLDDAHGHVHVDLTELYAYPASATDETTDADELYRVVDERIDLEPALRDAIGLALPLQPVCSDDCLGLCAECGVKLADAEPGHGHEQIDPRWAKLAQLRPAESGTDAEATDE